MKTSKASQCILLLALTLEIWAADSVLAGRPEYYGFSPALPKSSEVPPCDSAFPFILKEQSILLRLEIDQAGLFKRVLPNEENDSVISRYVLSSLKKVTFEPAIKRGEPLLSVLPVLATVNPHFNRTTIEFPLSADSQITNRSLYFLALEQLGAEFPKVKKFPPYFCNLSTKDSLNFLPFALLSVNMNEAGEVSSSDIVETNLPAYTRQIQSAALWADFSPLKFDNVAVPCTSFLLVSFFPQLQYPTIALEIESDSISKWHEYFRVQLLPDTVGLMMPAMPIHQEVGSLTRKGENKYLRGEFIADLAIDTLGNFRVTTIDIKNPPLQQALNLALKDIKFFPATAYNGKLVDFHGKAAVTFEGTSNITIKYLWLID